jgi:hypothetical protein
MKKIIILSLIFVSLFYNSAWADYNLVQLISSPVSGSVATYYPDGYSENTTGLFSASAYCVAYSEWVGYSDYNGASWTFQPKMNVYMSISHILSGMSLAFYNLTEETPPGSYPYGFNGTTFSLYEGHIYELDFSLYAFGENNWYGYASETAYFSSAPEPATMLLLGLGLIGLAGVRRKFQEYTVSQVS